MSKRLSTILNKHQIPEGQTRGTCNAIIHHEFAPNYTWASVAKTGCDQQATHLANPKDPNSLRCKKHMIRSISQQPGFSDIVNDVSVCQCRQRQNAAAIADLVLTYDKKRVLFLEKEQNARDELRRVMQQEIAKQKEIDHRALLGRVVTDPNALADLLADAKFDPKLVQRIANLHHLC